MKNLKLVHEKLKERKHDDISYFIPEVWNTIGFKRYFVDPKRPGEICVNPYEFIMESIEYCMKYEKSEHINKSINNSNIYSMFPRVFTAWDHVEKNKIYPGTFIKAICLLPMLKSFNIDIVYMLPVFKISNMYKKGEIGSPYSIKNIYKLDESLHDVLLGEYDDETVSVEFKALVEACHILGMRVMLDFVFRTVSRDNDLILEHPEWFYWIDFESSKTFTAPSIGDKKQGILLNDSVLDELYRPENTAKYLSIFTPPPNEIDPVKWNELIIRHENTDENILELIEKKYGITTVPGFSNVINDKQPAWTDVTYIKYYFDNSRKAKTYIQGNQIPYIMQDGVCLNLYPGENKNTELWDYITKVIPYYQINYGIDGARIDMGHALPCELNKEIIDRAKSIDRDFIFWSEEFNPEKSESVKEDGFHFISGATWAIYKYIEEENFYQKLIDDCLLKSHLPVTAALETPDTPRAAYVFNDKTKIKFLIMLNSFIPNAIPFLNNGLEVMEIQPMNLGLDNTEEGRFVLSKADNLYGKLAFFDSYALHWLNNDREWIKPVLEDAYKLRKRFIDIVSNKENFIRQHAFLKDIFFMGYFNQEINKGVFFLGNKNFKSSISLNLKDVLSEEFVKNDQSIELVYFKDLICSFKCHADDRLEMDPGEVIIGCKNYD